MALMAMEMNSTNYACPEPECTFRTSCERTLDAHRMAHLGASGQNWLPQGCTRCSKRFLNPQDFAKHQCQHASELYSCTTCAETFFFKIGLEMHREHFHGRDPQTQPRFACPHCKHVCLTSLGLAFHLRWRLNGRCYGHLEQERFAPIAYNLAMKTPGTTPTHEPSSPKSVPTPPPSTSSLDSPVSPGVVTASNSDAHYSPDLHRTSVSDQSVTELGDYGYSCQQCGSLEPTKELAAAHMRMKHPDLFESKGNFECQFCGKKCTTQSGLDYHKRTHMSSVEERRAYRCEECNQEFTVRSTLYRHRRTQHGATLDERKPHKCAFCGKAFASRYNLNRHTDTRHPGSHSTRTTMG